MRPSGTVSQPASGGRTKPRERVLKSFVCAAALGLAASAIAMSQAPADSLIRNARVVHGDGRVTGPERDGRRARRPHHQRRAGRAGSARRSRASSPTGHRRRGTDDDAGAHRRARARRALDGRRSPSTASPPSATCTATPTRSTRWRARSRPIVPASSRRGRSSTARVASGRTPRRWAPSARRARRSAGRSTRARGSSRSTPACSRRWWR